MYDEKFTHISQHKLKHLCKWELCILCELTLKQTWLIFSERGKGFCCLGLRNSSINSHIIENSCYNPYSHGCFTGTGLIARQPHCIRMPCQNSNIVNVFTMVVSMIAAISSYELKSLPMDGCHSTVLFFSFPIRCCTSIPFHIFLP